MLSETAKVQASNVQRSVIERLGVQGDKALLGELEKRMEKTFFLII